MNASEIYSTLKQAGFRAEILAGNVIVHLNRGVSESEVYVALGSDVKRSQVQSIKSGTVAVRPQA